MSLLIAPSPIVTSLIVSHMIPARQKVVLSELAATQSLISTGVHSSDAKRRVNAHMVELFSLRQVADSQQAQRASRFVPLLVVVTHAEVRS